MLLGRNLIFHLSRDEEHAARLDYFFPFFGWSNLTDPAGKSDEVKAAISKEMNVTD